MPPRMSMLLAAVGTWVLLVSCDDLPEDTVDTDSFDDPVCVDDDCETTSCVWVNASSGGYWRSCPNEDCPCANN